MSTTPELTTRNADLADLAAMLQDQHARKIDMVVPAGQVRADHGRLRINNAEPIVEADGVTDPNGLYRPTRVCDEGVASKLNIPLAYLRRLRADRPDLWDANVNGWLHGRRRAVKIDGPDSVPRYEHEQIYPGDDRSFLLRTFRPADGKTEGVARAFVSSRYRIIDNLDVLTAALEGVRDAGVDVNIEGCDLTERRMHIRISAPEVAALAPELLGGYRSPFTGASGSDNPTVFAGFVISNSEVGGGAFTITPRLVVQVCRNGMTMQADAMRDTHLGGRLDDGVIRWSDQTQQQNLDLVASKARDAVATFLDLDYMRSVITRVEADAATPVDAPQQTIEHVGKRLGFGQDRLDGVLDHFIRGGQMTAGGVFNAVTSYAQTIDDANDAFDLEAQALPALTAAAAGGAR